MRRISLVIKIYIIFTIVLISNSFANVPDSAPFHLSLKKEAIISLSGISCYLAGNYFISNITIPDPTTLNRENVNKIERFACDYYSKKLSYISDNTKDATTLLLALTFISHLKEINRENIRILLSDVVLFAEAESMIVGITRCAKGLSERPRPFVYNSTLSLEKRQKKSSYESFWSGHASLAFMTAVFTGYVYQNHHPGSNLILPVWITGLSCATATSILRVSSGNHFPSDVIVGAAVGSCIGWFIPWIHKKKNNSFSLTSNIAGLSGLGILYHF
jgi:membrane-associated phospholipid phosphatase